MLQLKVPSVELYDSETNTFSKTNEIVINLEHSLVSISKWEAKWNKSFFSSKDKSLAEVIDYIKCMTVSPNVDDKVYDHLPASTISEIQKYIDAPMTATSFSNRRESKNFQRKQVVTSELIYYWMISFGIPFECQKWHINRLLTLIKVCDIKQSSGNKKNKMKNSEIFASNKELNAARRAAMQSKG